MDNRPKSEQAALTVAQDAVAALLKWAGMSKTPTRSNLKNKAVQKAKEYLDFDADSSKIGALRLLFDDVKLTKGQESTSKHWCRMGAIANELPAIPYPIQDKPDSVDYKNTIKEELESLFDNAENWQNLSLLSLILEKYGSCLSYGQNNIALVDAARITGAVAAALAQAPEAQQLSLVAGDLSGIQNFIYTISSDGALKSLRARSFYLELVTEEVVQQILETLELPRTSIIYAGGGNLYVLAPAQDEGDKLKGLQNQLNTWLLEEFQGKIFLALGYKDFEVEQVNSSDFDEVWNGAIEKVNEQKNRKFFNKLERILELQFSHSPCPVCHRDDTNDLKPLTKEPDSSQACPTCREMFELGNVLFKVKAVARSRRSDQIKGSIGKPIVMKIGNSPDTHIYYHLFEHQNLIMKDSVQSFLINNWNINCYSFSQNKSPTHSLLLGNYFKLGEEGYMRAGEFAEVAQSAGCIPRVGYLRMDVDNLGMIFAKGLKNTSNYSLSRVAGLSRQMSYFFKTYLNSLAQKRDDNLPTSVKVLKPGNRENLLFIYAGGDDVFVVGAWNEVTDFAFDVYQSFREYTGYNQDITLSAGVILAKIKYPLYQAADDSGKAEGKAKDNGRDSLGMFGEVFKWSAWLGNLDQPMLSSEDQQYLTDISKPELEGVLPFVYQLTGKFDIGYSQGFIRNLLALAQFRTQKLKEITEKQKQDVKYFLHLPKLAYTLSRLPKNVRDAPEFKPVRSSLMSPRNSPYFRAIATWIELLTRNS